MLRFQTQLQVSSIADELINNQFEVIMPKMNISDFSQNLCSCNSSFLSQLISTVGLETYIPIVEQISFKPRTFKTNTSRVRTGWYNLPDDIENYQDVTITMFCSAGMLTQYYLAAWKAMIFNEEGEYYYPSYVYKKNIEVYVYGPNNVALGEETAVAHFTLKGCFPVSQDPFKFEYSNNPKRVTITATFKVDKITFDKSLSYSSIVQELLTSPTGLIDKTISNLTSKNSNYSINDVYG